MSRGRRAASRCKCACARASGRVSPFSMLGRLFLALVAIGVRRAQAFGFEKFSCSVLRPPRDPSCPPRPHARVLIDTKEHGESPPGRGKSAARHCF
eukprot:4383481-Pleurochrysis_carterae.AAC.1